MATGTRCGTSTASWLLATKRSTCAGHRAGHWREGSRQTAIRGTPKKLCTDSKTKREVMGKNVSPARSCLYRCCPDDLMLFTGEQSSKAGLRFLPVEWKKPTPKPQHKCAVSPHSSERGEQRWRAQGLPPSRAKEGKSYGEPPTTFNKGPEQRRALLNASAKSFAFI